MFQIVDICSVMHIGHNNMEGNYNMSNQQMFGKDQQRDLRIIITKYLKRQKQTDNEYWGSFIACNFRCKIKTDSTTIQISSSPTSRICLQFWSPHLRRDIDKIEKVQRRAIKITEIRNQSYNQRIKEVLSCQGQLIK